MTKKVRRGEGKWDDLDGHFYPKFIIAKNQTGLMDTENYRDKQLINFQD